jgi:hypothetical protein
MKQTLKIKTPYGEFNRTTNTAYTHAAVAIPTSRNGVVYAGAADLATQLIGQTSGVMARVLKDRGYIVSWHKSYAAALYAAEKGPSAYFRTHLGIVVEVPKRQDGAQNARDTNSPFMLAVRS